MRDTFKKIEKLYHNKSHITGLPSGFYDLDRLTAGFQPGELIIFAARPGMGKTAFALNIAQKLAVENKIAVAIFSLEMSKEQLAQRMICAQAEVDAHRLRTGALKQEDWPKLTQAMAELSEAPVFMDDTPGVTIMELRAKSRRIKLQKNVQLVLIDYLQLITTSSKNVNRNEQISEISRGLKGLAKELSIPVIALSQLSRDVEKRTDKRPQLSDLRESGAIEQDADLVGFIYRDDYYNTESEENFAEIIVAKQRNGPLGKVELVYKKEFTKFDNKNIYEVEGF